MNSDVIKIVAGWLGQNGFDGLFNADIPCGCLVEDGLSPGGCFSEHCEAGYVVRFPDHQCGGAETVGCDGDCDYHVQRDKPGSTP